MLVRSLKRYEFKTGPLSSHGRILRITETWPKDFRILEVGTASGYLGRELCARGFSQVVGIEQDPQLAKLAQPHYLMHYVMDLEEDNLNQLGQFDALICADVLEHLRDPLEQLRRLSAVVRPKGPIVISLPNIVHWSVRFMVLSGRFEYAERGLLDRSHLRFFTLRTARELMKAAGLHTSHLYATPIPMTLFDGWMSLRFAALLERFYYSLTVCWKTFFAYQFVFVAERENVFALSVKTR